MTRSMNATAAAAMLALLAGCGSSDEAPQPAVTVTELGAGVHAVSTGDAASPVEGKYYAAADGSRLLVLNDAGQQANALYRRDAGGAWQAWPAVTADTAVDLAGSSAVPYTVLNAASVVGRYAVRLATGETAALSVTAAGDIVPGGSACKLAGKVAATPLPNALKLTLTATGCGDVPAQADGYLVIDGDYAPAAFRLLAAGGKAPVDLWAFAE